MHPEDVRQQIQKQHVDEINAETALGQLFEDFAAAGGAVPVLRTEFLEQHEYAQRLEHHVQGKVAVKAGRFARDRRQDGAHVGGHIKRGSGKQQDDRGQHPSRPPAAQIVARYIIERVAHGQEEVSLRPVRAESGYERGKRAFAHAGQEEVRQVRCCGKHEDREESHRQKVLRGLSAFREFAQQRRSDVQPGDQKQEPHMILALQEFIDHLKRRKARRAPFGVSRVDQAPKAERCRDPQQIFAENGADREGLLRIQEQ